MPDASDFEFGEEITCPRCGATEGFKPAQVEQNSGGAMLLLGGLLPYLLYKSSGGDPQVYCSRCHYVFRPSTPSSLKGTLIFLLIASIIVAILAIVTWR